MNDRRTTAVAASPPLGGDPPLYERVAGRLRAMVVSGELAPGDLLPNETELAAVFAVSRASMRESLRVLSSQQLIEVRRGAGGGSFIATPRIGAFTEILSAGIGLLTRTNVISVDDLLAGRELLEIPAAAMAAERCTEGRLEALADAVAGARGPSDDRFRHDAELHLAVIGASGNPVLTLMAEPIFEVLHHRFRRDQAPASLWDRVDEDHAQILDRVGARDADGAAEAMRRHLRHLHATYIAIDKVAG